MTQPELDPERIAALLDGRLSGQEREDLLAQLASSREHLELFADASIIASELGLIAPTAEPASDIAVSKPDVVTPLVAAHAPAPNATVVNVPPSVWRRRWPAAVAAGLLIVFTPLALKRLGLPRGDTSTLVAQLGSGIPARWDGAPWGDTRGATAALTEKARAVRTGARLADLELTVAASDTAARTIVDDVIALIGANTSSGPVTQVYEALRDSIGTAKSELAPLVQRGHDGAADLLGRSDVALGSWMEAARIAASRKNTGFFASAQSSRALRDLAANAGDQQTKNALSALTALLPVSATTNWNSLEAATTELLRASAR